MAKYAFVLGSIQIIASTAIFSGFELPVGNALGSNILEALGGQPGLVEIRAVDEVRRVKHKVELIKHHTK